MVLVGLTRKTWTPNAEIAKERDHRKLGKELDLSSWFLKKLVKVFHSGCQMRDHPSNWNASTLIASSGSYQHVYTPPIVCRTYKTRSLGHYREDMFPPMDMGDGEELVLRPMSCPHHIEVYKHHVHSYREFLANCIVEIDDAPLWKSGALDRSSTCSWNVSEWWSYLCSSRTNRGRIQEDPSIDHRCMKTLTWQITVSACLIVILKINTNHFFDNDEMGKCSTLLKAAVTIWVLYYEAEGEAAFYGPKLISKETVLGKEETFQLFNWPLLPERFDLHYIGADGEHRPVMHPPWVKRRNEKRTKTSCPVVYDES